MSAGQEVGEIFGEGSGPAAALLRSPTVIIASIALWGMNVYCFKLFKIDYGRVLMLDVKKEEEREQARERELQMQRGSQQRNNKDISPSRQRQLNSSSKKRIRRRDGTIHMEVSTSDSIDVESDNVCSDLELLESSDNPKDDDSQLLSNDKSMVVVSLDSQDDINGAGKNTDKDEQDHYKVSETKLISLSAFLMVTLHLTSYLWIKIANGSTIGAIFLFYLLVLAGIALPIDATKWVRLAGWTVLFRAKELLNPRCSCFTRNPRPIPFVDVFFADAMCSLSKVFFDWGMLWLLASHYPHPVPPSAQKIIMPSCFASLPYIIRARQCLVMYNVGLRKKDPKRYQHVLNAIKYSTSLFPLIVSAFQKTETGKLMEKQLEIVLVVLLIVNASYSLLWDIMMDWGMMQNPSAVVEHTVGQCAGMTPVPTSLPPNNMKIPPFQSSCIDATLRPRLRFGTMNSLLILILDIFLRFSWTLRFYESMLFSSNGAYILCTEFLEVFRRAVWNLLRVEWEQIKQTKAEKTAVKEKEDGIMMVGMKRSDSVGDNGNHILGESPLVETLSRGESNDSSTLARTSTSREVSRERNMS